MSAPCGTFYRNSVYAKRRRAEDRRTELTSIRVNRRKLAGVGRPPAAATDADRCASGASVEHTTVPDASAWRRALSVLVASCLGGRAVMARPLCGRVLDVERTVQLGVVSNPADTGLLGAVHREVRAVQAFPVGVPG